jgi:HlyD family secretion protein
MMKKIILVVVVLCTVGGMVWFYQKYYSEKKNVLILYGNVDIREVNLGFRVAGRLAKLFFDEGDQIRHGESLALLDDEPYGNEVVFAAAKVKSQKEQLRLLETGNRPQEIAEGRALVREREITATNSRRKLERKEKTLLINGVSTQDRDDAKASYKRDEAQLASARESLNLLEAGFRVEDIARAKADLKQTQAQLASAELKVKDTVLTAPSDGVILTRAQESGAILQAGTTVFTLSLQHPVWIRAYVHEPDLGHIHPGTKVAIYTDSRPDKPYKGQIGFISPTAEFTPKTVETTELRTALVYRLRIVVDSHDEGLRQGMPVTVRIATDASVSPVSPKQ